MYGYLVSSEIVKSEPYVRYLPMMIGRLMLSLKKASASFHEDLWSFGEPRTDNSVRFAGGRGLEAARDGIRLDTFGDRHEWTRSDE